MNTIIKNAVLKTALASVGLYLFSLLLTQVGGRDIMLLTVKTFLLIAVAHVWLEWANARESGAVKQHIVIMSVAMIVAMGTLAYIFNF